MQSKVQDIAQEATVDNLLRVEGTDIEYIDSSRELMALYKNWFCDLPSLYKEQSLSNAISDIGIKEFAIADTFKGKIKVPDYSFIASTIQSICTNFVLVRSGENSKVFFLFISLRKPILQKTLRERMKKIIMYICQEDPDKVLIQSKCTFLRKARTHAEVLEYMGHMAGGDLKNVLTTITNIPLGKSSVMTEATQQAVAKTNYPAKMKKAIEQIPVIIAGNYIRELQPLFHSGSSLNQKVAYFNSLNHSNMARTVAEYAIQLQIQKEQIHDQLVANLIKQQSELIKVKYFTAIMDQAGLEYVPHPPMLLNLDKASQNLRAAPCFDLLEYDMLYGIPCLVIGKLMAKVFFRNPYIEGIDNNHMTVCLSGIGGSGKSDIISAIGCISPPYRWMKNNTSTFQSIKIVQSSWCEFTEMSNKELKAKQIMYKELFDYNGHCQVDVKGKTHIDCTQFMPMVFATNDSQSKMQSESVDVEEQVIDSNVSAILRRIQYVKFFEQFHILHSGEHNSPALKNCPWAQSYSINIKGQYKQSIPALANFFIAMGVLQQEFPIVVPQGTSLYLGRIVKKFSQTIFGICYLVERQSFSTLMNCALDLMHSDVKEVARGTQKEVWTIGVLERKIYNVAYHGIQKICQKDTFGTGNILKILEMFHDQSVPKKLLFARLVQDRGIANMLFSVMKEDIQDLVLAALSEDVNKFEFLEGFKDIYGVTSNFRSAGVVDTTTSQSAGNDLQSFTDFDQMKGFEEEKADFFAVFTQEQLHQMAVPSQQEESLEESDKENIEPMDYLGRPMSTSQDTVDMGSLKRRRFQ